MKKTFVVIISLMILTACGGGEEKKLLDVTSSTFGLIGGEGEITEGYKFVPANHDYLLDVEIENTGKSELLVEAVWQYRESGGFRQILNTVRKADPGLSQLEFPFQSNIDMVRGEYMVELYYEENLLTAHRFWVLTPGKEANSDIDIFELTKCSAKATDEQCMAEEICEALYIQTEGMEKPLEVCEAR